MPPRLPPYHVTSTPGTTELLESMYRQWQSPHARELGEAVALIAGGEELKAALLLRQVVRTMEDNGASPYDREPVLRLSADAWSRVAMRFASSFAEYTTGVSQRMRIDFLLESLADYILLEDAPNQVRIYRAISTAYLSGGRPGAADVALEKAFKLATTHLALSPQEMRQLIVEREAAGKAAADRHYLKPVVAARSAAYSQLLGHGVQAMVLLEKAYDRFLNIAQNFHQMKHHDKALAALTKAVVLGIMAGRENVIIQHADLLVQYAILNGDGGARIFYDRALGLARLGMGATSDRMIQERAQFLLDSFSVRHASESFHSTIGLCVKYFVSLAKGVTQKGDYQNPKSLDVATALADGAYLGSDAWRRTLDLFEPFLGKPFADQLWKDGMVKLAEGSAQHEAAVKLAATHYQVTRRPMFNASPALIQLLADATEHPEIVPHVYMQIAHGLNCSIAEAESLFTPYGDAQLRGRLREVLGELTFSHLRSMAMRHDLDARRVRWEKLFREKSLKK